MLQIWSCSLINDCSQERRSVMKNHYNAPGILLENISDGNLLNRLVPLSAWFHPTMRNYDIVSSEIALFYLQSASCIVKPCREVVVVVVVETSRVSVYRRAAPPLQTLGGPISIRFQRASARRSVTSPVRVPDGVCECIHTRQKCRQDGICTEKQ